MARPLGPVPNPRDINYIIGRLLNKHVRSFSESLYDGDYLTQERRAFPLIFRFQELSEHVRGLPGVLEP